MLDASHVGLLVASAGEVLPDRLPFGRLDDGAKLVQQLVSLFRPGRYLAITETWATDPPS
jgi:hypothetical protein